MNNCIQIINFDKFNFTMTQKKKGFNYLDFTDAIFIISVKKDLVTNRQLNCINNINFLGCNNITYWCFTAGYKKCNYLDINHNIIENVKSIINFSFKNNFNNIVIFEDDFTFNKKTILKNLLIKKNLIKTLIYEHRLLDTVIFLGYIPINIKIKKNNIITGRFGNGHALLLNKGSMNRILKYPNIKYQNNYYFDYNGKVTKSLDSLLYLDPQITHLAIWPNDLFFQLSDPNSNLGESENKILKSFYYLQYLFTGEMYYQYNPKFVSIYEKFIWLISWFFNEKEPAIIILQKKLFKHYKLILLTISLILIIFTRIFYLIYFKKIKYNFTLKYNININK